MIDDVSQWYKPVLTYAISGSVVGGFGEYFVVKAQIYTVSLLDFINAIS